MSEAGLASSQVSPEEVGYPDDPLAQVCGEVAAVFKRAWGRGPVRTTAQWAGPTSLVVLLENGHTDAERTLRAAGLTRELLAGRQLLALAIEDELKERVERILGRPVQTLLSATRLDPDLSAQIFLLEKDDPDPPPAQPPPSLIGRAKHTHARAHELGDEMRAVTRQHGQGHRPPPSQKLHP
jgi:uncharacterized protein YbcI